MKKLTISVIIILLVGTVGFRANTDNLDINLSISQSYSIDTNPLNLDLSVSQTKKITSEVPLKLDLSISKLR